MGRSVVTRRGSDGNGAVFVSEDVGAWEDRGRLRDALDAAYRRDETETLVSLVDEVRLDAEARRRGEADAAALVEGVRERRVGQGGLDAFLHEYALTTQEGIVLMCLAEALLRIPDGETADRLIHDKIGGAHWEGHVGHSDSLFVNASTWALMLTGHVVRLGDAPSGRAAFGRILPRLVQRSGEPVIRRALGQAMRILGRQFVMGRTIDEALARARDEEAKGYRYSYDMLGEAARTMADADRYLASYTAAIGRIGRASGGRGPISGPGISVKLSALHPRYELAQADRMAGELVPRLVSLCEAAKAHDIGLTIDAEEADRFDLSLDVLDAVATDPRLAGWNGLGLALQAYQKRARPSLDWLADLARRGRRRLMVRLVKGAYWDTEIKRAQEGGYTGYPVFTRKASTDVSYLACARRLLADPEAFFPQFATHNAHTVAAVQTMAGGVRGYEFQRLHGMGVPLYEQIVGPKRRDLPCRVYAPVGSHEELLPYLVRRLLENGANSSFVNRIADEDLPVAEIVADPVARTEALPRKPHPRIPLPRDIYGPDRPNALGVDLADRRVLVELASALTEAAAEPWRAGPLIGGKAGGGAAETVYDPADRRRAVGDVVRATADEVGRAVAIGAAAQPAWDTRPAEGRAEALSGAADLLEERHAAFMAMAVREGGKSLKDAVAELREAVDFLRYYAGRARLEFAVPERLPGPTGETNDIALRGRGVFACVSPWNFPLAIFTGQVAAALAAGNAVVAKPAPQTPLIAAAMVRLLHEAGVPEDVLHLAPGGPEVGAALVGDPRIAGIAFTGSTATARAIARARAALDGPIIPLIAETGGQNAMIVDSSALAEQVVADVVVSAFQSAGQRCSACRVLFVQREVADPLLTMLAGAMAELRIGDPGRLSTDVGPVIDAAARERLEAHAAAIAVDGRVIHRSVLGPETEHGTFVAPMAVEIDRLDRLREEVFGPILHVVRFSRDRIGAVVDAVNATGFGLTLGVHSRVDSTIAEICRRARVGNIYVNRNMIGAIVGVQPFGGEGLSGTGPKAGGPRYLHRFATERVVSVDTTAAGGNAALMSLGDEG